MDAPGSRGSGLENDFEWLWENAPCGYLTTTPDGVITRTNATLCAWLGYDVDHLVGRRTFADLLAPSAKTQYDAQLMLTLQAEGRLHDVALDIERSDGTRLAARVSSVLERDADGTPVAVRSVVVDATESNVDQDLVDAEERAGESETRAQALIHALQQTLIPPALPSVPGLDVAAAYHPAQGEVGGDFYDVFEVADGDWCIVIGDVSGKGTGAAIVTSAVRHTVRSSALREGVPSGLLTALNAALLDHPTSRFCTVALVRLQRSADAWVATMTTGGHPFPLLVRHRTATRLGKPGSLLGMFDDVEFHDVSIKLASGDALVVYTDGVVEARNAAGELYGEERLHAAIASADASAQAIVHSVVSAVLDFQENRAGDDIALVVIRRP